MPIPPVIWQPDELAVAVAARAVSAAQERPPDERAGGLTRERRRAEVARQIADLRAVGKTWAEVSAATGLSPSRVRAIHAADGASGANGGHGEEGAAPPDDDALLANLRAFLDEAAVAGTPTSRRAYAAWTGRVASPATIAARFGSWAAASGRAYGQTADTQRAPRYA